jgi:hypothetical protein
MGLLDDAIREHLELKRRRGADPEEVARQESEALGDPRAPMPEAGASAEAPSAAGDEVMPVTPDPDATRVVDPAAAEPELDDLAPPALEPDPDPVVPYEPAEPDLEPGPEPEPEAAIPPSAPREEAPWLDDDPPTEEHAPPPPTAREPEPEGPAVDEDVLEETPDFLQETPEHDRLWFEQKPPRDFDFDS